MALATMFVTLPFVVRELIPILETMDLSEVRCPCSLPYLFVSAIVKAAYKLVMRFNEGA